MEKPREIQQEFCPSEGLLKMPEKALKYEKLFLHTGLHGTMFWICAGNSWQLRVFS